MTIDLLAISRFAYLLPILPQPPSLQGGEPEIEDAGLPQAPHNDGDEEPEDLFGHLDDVKFASTIGIFGHLDDVKFASTIGIIAHGEYGSNSDGTIPVLAMSFVLGLLLLLFPISSHRFA